MRGYTVFLQKLAAYSYFCVSKDNKFSFRQVPIELLLPTLVSLYYTAPGAIYTSLSDGLS